jgi:hypothetical protein
MFGKTVTIDGENYNAYTLARMVGVCQPEENDNAGATFLLDIADTYLTERDSIREADYPSDRVQELVPDTSALATATKWAIFTDLRLYAYDSQFLHPDNYQRRTDPNCSWSELENIPVRQFLDDGPGILLDEIAGNLLSILYGTHDYQHLDREEN